MGGQVERPQGQGMRSGFAQRVNRVEVAQGVGEPAAADDQDHAVGPRLRSRVGTPADRPGWTIEQAAADLDDDRPGHRGGLRTLRAPFLEPARAAHGHTRRSRRPGPRLRRQRDDPSRPARAPSPPGDARGTRPSPRQRHVGGGRPWRPSPGSRPPPGGRAGPRRRRRANARASSGVKPARSAATIRASRSRGGVDGRGAAVGRGEVVGLGGGSSPEGQVHVERRRRTARPSGPSAGPGTAARGPASRMRGPSHPDVDELSGLEPVGVGPAPRDGDDPIDQGDQVGRRRADVDQEPRPLGDQSGGDGRQRQPVGRRREPRAARGSPRPGGTGRRRPRRRPTGPGRGRRA